MIQYKDGYEYQLVQGATFAVPELTGHTALNDYVSLSDGVLTIGRGYAFDGPSGPTWDSKAGMQAALCHDALYQMIREGLIPRILKDLADRIFYRICLDDGMGKIRAWYWYQGVKRFGRLATIQNKDIRVAP